MSLQLRAAGGSQIVARPYQYGGILPFLVGAAGFLAKAVPVVTSIVSGFQQVRQAVEPILPQPVAPVVQPMPMEDDIDSVLASLSDEELIQLAMDEGLLSEADLPAPASPIAPPPVFTAPALRTTPMFSPTPITSVIRTFTDRRQAL